jgi:hypothetical protein
MFYLTCFVIFFFIFFNFFNEFLNIKIIHLNLNTNLQFQLQLQIKQLNEKQIIQLNNSNIIQLNNSNITISTEIFQPICHILKFKIKQLNCTCPRIPSIWTRENAFQYAKLNSLFANCIGIYQPASAFPDGIIYVVGNIGIRSMIQNWFETIIKYVHNYYIVLYLVVSIPNYLIGFKYII